MGNQRAVQLVTNFSHYNKDGSDPIVPLAKGLGVYDSYYATEDIGIDGFDSSNQKTANAIVTRVKQSEGHWADLMNPSFSKIGVGLYNASDGTLYIAIELGY